jgi:hypothetical protein
MRIPLPGGAFVTLGSSRPVTEDEWGRLMGVLEGLKFGFLVDSERAAFIEKATAELDDDDED